MKKIIEYDVRLAFKRSHGYCECRRTDHLHKGRCGNPVLWRSRGLRTPYATLFGVWDARHIISVRHGGRNNAKNIQVICSECDRKLKDWDLRSKN